MAFAQVKGSFKKAQAFLEKGDIAQAQQEIEAAMADPKQSSKGAAWLVKGQVYQSIALSDDANIQGLAADAIDQALQAYAKVKELEKEGSPIRKQLEETQGVDYNTMQIRPSIMDEFRNQYFQKGADQYNEEDYKNAMSSFETCYKILPSDTLAGLYAMTCAAILEDLPGVKRNAEALVGMEYHDSKMYGTWARAVYAKAAKSEGAAATEMWEEVLRIAKLGQAKNPSDGDMVKFMIDAYIRMGRKEDAISSLEASVQADPSDKVAYFSLGTLYDELKDYEKSEAAFKKALSIDADYFDANLNYFVMVNNQIRMSAEAYNALIDSRGQFTDEAKAKALEGEIKGLREKAIAILEKCHAIDAGNRIVIENLAFLYNAMNMTEKYEAMEKLLGDE